MIRIWKGLAVIALAGSSFALYGTSTAGATGPNDSFTMTVSSKATYVDKFRTAVTVSGTYTCTIESGWTPSQQYSGLNLNLTQVQGKVVVQGGGGIGGPGSEFPACDGQPHAWAVQIPANSGSGGGGGGSPATWKNGKAIISGGGNVADGTDCGGMGGPGSSNCMGTQFNQTLKIS